MSVDSRLEIQFGGFSTGYRLPLDTFLVRDVEDAFNPTHLIGY